MSVIRARCQIRAVGVELADGELLVSHAMRLRRGYIDAYAKVMACHEQ